MTSEPSRATVPKGLPGDDQITGISVSGYKSLDSDAFIELKPLTLLAGANSSGKSSMMQPLLMMKQTLDASFDPGALAISGPNVKFTSVGQFVPRLSQGELSRFSVGVTFASDSRVMLKFTYRRNRGIKVDSLTCRMSDRELVFQSGLSSAAVRELVPIDVAEEYESSLDAFTGRLKEENAFPEWSFGKEWTVKRERCFLVPAIKPIAFLNEQPAWTSATPRPYTPPIVEQLKEKVRGIIHLPGLRGNPERAYPVTGIGPSFPGVFQDYAASVISLWQSEKRWEKVKSVTEHLAALDLTWGVRARSTSDTQVELKVTRSKLRADRNWVNVADVGLGVSQTLPVIVALIAAASGQIVFIEQPEIHLHPRAQFALAKVFADAVKRGVRIIAETHSSTLLLGVQTLVAQGALSASDVKLHWFHRTEHGNTRISSADLSSSGSFGDWPQDFADVALRSESQYLDAAESKLLDESRAEDAKAEEES